MTLIMKSLLSMKIQILLLLFFIKRSKADSAELKMSTLMNEKSEEKINKDLLYPNLQNFFLFLSDKNRNKDKHINTKIRSLTIFYNTFDNEINSVYGTGNILKDVVYKVNCVIKCKSKCCSGENFSAIECLSQSKCNRKIQKMKKFILKMALISYASLAILTSLIIFLIYFLISKRFYETRQSLKNALAAMFFCLSIFLILPIILLLVYSKIKRKGVFEILGGEFSKYKSIIATTETKDEEKLITNRKQKNTEDNNSIEIKLDKNLNFDLEEKLDREANNNTQKIRRDQEIKLDSESNLINDENDIYLNQIKKNKIIKSFTLNFDHSNQKIRDRDRNKTENNSKMKIDNEGYSYYKNNKLMNDSDFYSDMNKNLNFFSEEGVGSHYDKKGIDLIKEKNKIYNSSNSNISVNEINLDNEN